MNMRRLLLACGVTAATLATLAAPAPAYIVWNASASVPTGLYAIGGKTALALGERVAIAPPPRLRAMLASRNYLPAGVPLIKRIAARGGQRVCRFGPAITIDGDFAGSARARDRRGRRLPAWSGCHLLRAGELFAMNPHSPDSFDGRYFGVLRSADLIGRAIPIWTDETGADDHVWFAAPTAAASAPKP